MIFRVVTLYYITCPLLNKNIQDMQWEREYGQYTEKKQSIETILRKHTDWIYIFPMN